jgi:hypothetical protein
MSKNSHHRGKGKKQAAKQRRAAENEEIERLEREIKQMDLPLGSNPLAEDESEKKLKRKDKDQDSSAPPTFKSFSELPISSPTLKGLKAGGFEQMTAIQV